MTDNHPTGRVFVCGAGHQGLSMAAHLTLCGVSVSLWNRTPDHIARVMESREIHCSGIVEGTAHIDTVTSHMSQAVSDFVMVTTPSSAHRDIARRLAPFVHKDMTVVLNPGRTFGAIDFARTLTECGATELPHIAETQTIVYTCRRSSLDGVTIYALKNGVELAGLRPGDAEYIMQRMPECLAPYFRVVPSVAYTSLANVGMVLHCAPVLMNVGWIETEKVDFKYYYDGISESVSAFIEKIDSERISVAKALGYKIESTCQWMRRTYGIEGEDLHSCIRNNETYREIDAPPTIHCRYILEDVPNGLVPIEHIGKALNVPTPCIGITIDLACAVLGMDFRAAGRRFTIDELKKYI